MARTDLAESPKGTAPISGALPIPFEKLPISQRIHWVHTILLTVTPVAALYGLLTTPWVTKTFILTVVTYFMTGFGITAGYHRLWSHRAYDAPLATRIFFAIIGGSAVQGNILWWCRDHRVHHRFTDTEKDPYGAQNGFWYSHLIWMLFKKDRNKIGKADVTDLYADPVVMWQRKYYVPIILIFSVILPTCIAGFGWGDWRGGYFYAVVLRMVIVHHATFCVNSLAHWLGESSFDDKHTPRDHIITALITFGEGYHNFHHQFPQDYRNAIKFFQYDPTKWLILALSSVGLASNLRTFPKNEVQKGQVMMQQKKIDAIKAKIKWGPTPDVLPSYTMAEYEREVQENGRSWLLVDGFIHDVTNFIDEHPGGPKYLKTYLGRDATRAFDGGVYDHSNAARNLMSMMRIAVLATTDKKED
ncbi:stearoyl-CoA 9-desaturase [Tieghemiomyces parasiticus]|uniref:Acyl-CoA desaturase n=1 Tax=Tieghemiomyces parasiticus TaxID=78921 RepID=A0A9W8DP95_9FUNG|nr:stearoyl-CoA 9-desaturase [Tieghemiomyces parasiticus]